jgi:hypothetical protein
LSAILKVYTDAAHTSEVAHTAQNSTTLNGATLAGATAFTLLSTAGMPTQGFIDIDSAGNLETLPYYGLSGNVIQIARTGGAQFAHANGVAVVQWYYSLAVGDQTNGILNDGSNAGPTVNDTATWYLYNAGDQVAQSISLATQAGAPSTTQGFTDSVISITSAAAGFATSVSPANLAAGSVQQFWLAAQVPSGQSAAGNPQICQVNISYQSI